MSAHPDKLPLIHGLVDGELDAANSMAIEAHLKSCSDCRAELERIEALREMLGSANLVNTAPAGLRSRVEAMLDAEGAPAVRRAEPSRPRQVVGGGIMAHVLSGRWASGAVAGALAACLALTVAVPQLSYTGTEEQLVQSHVRSLLVGHVVDVMTSNRHVVKPWFNGKIDFAPPVPELADEGFPLVGGRLDYVEDKAVAAIVYRRRLHVINLFVRPAATLSLPVAVKASHNGYNLARWTANGLEYWAVSDLDARELQLFQKLYSARARP
jgi:anti-sigma factor RsiW